jgi:hypothetical protein
MELIGLIVVIVVVWGLISIDSRLKKILDLLREYQKREEQSKRVRELEPLK